MSLAEIKAEIPKLTAEERDELAVFLRVCADMNQPGFKAELTRAVDEIESGVNVMTKAEALTRLNRATSRA